MKIFCSFFSLIVVSSAMSQEATPGAKVTPNAQTNDIKVVDNANASVEGQGGDNKTNVRNASNSVKLATHDTAPLPYDVDDKYMGRAAEFKQLFKSKKLPADFPVYEKQYGWGIREYNAVVGAYLLNNKDLLTDAVLKKISSGNQ